MRLTQCSVCLCYTPIGWGRHRFINTSLLFTMEAMLGEWTRCTFHNDTTGGTKPHRLDTFGYSQLHCSSWGFDVKGYDAKAWINPSYKGPKFWFVIKQWGLAPIFFLSFFLAGISNSWCFFWKSWESFSKTVQREEENDFNPLFCLKLSLKTTSLIF